MATVNVLDLCCGAGMASMGLASAGCEIIGGIDIWADAQAVVARSFDVLPELVDYDDGDDVGARVDVVITGPPCQDDCLANHGKDKGRGEIKRWALGCAQAYNPTWIVMEMVTREWIPWCEKNGATQIFKLTDSELGGYTQRSRWFAIWGPTSLKIGRWKDGENGWGQALLIDDPKACLATEANSKAKRWRRAKNPSEPAPAVVGGDRRHLLRLADGTEKRLGPREAAALSGFPMMQLDVQLSERKLQTMIGNGWPKSFGFVIGQALLASTPIQTELF